MVFTVDCYNVIKGVSIKCRVRSRVHTSLVSFPVSYLGKTIALKKGRTLTLSEHLTDNPFIAIITINSDKQSAVYISDNCKEGVNQIISKE